MENASKALIIAGAILLAIVIISLGLVVVNNVRNVTDNTNLSEQEIQSFNAKFTAYEGDNVSASRVNSLIQTVIATNQATYDSGDNNFIIVAYRPSNYENYTNKYIKISLINNVLSYGRITGNPEDDSYFTQGKTDGISINCNQGSGSGSSAVVAPMLSVKTGNTYTVKIVNYSNGLIKSILIK